MASLGCTVHEAASSILKLAPSTVDNHKGGKAMAKLGTDKAAPSHGSIKLKITSLSDALTTAEKRSGRKNDGWN